MRSSTVVLLAVVTIAAAQSGSSQAMPVVATALPRSSCPIDIEVLQQPHGAYLLAASDRTVHPTYQVTFHPREDRAIQQVVLDVSGPSGLRLRNAAISSTAGSTDTVQTFTLAGSHATIATKKLTAVEWFSLVSVTYAAGSRWHRTGTDVCYVPPNGFARVQ